MGKYLQKERTGLIWLESLLLTLVLLGFLYSKCGVYFEMNDDRMINEILTGVLTGTPDGHAIFVNYLLGGFLAFLYALFPSVPWFGGLLMFSHLAVYWCFFGLVLEKCRNVYQHLLGILCGVFLVFSNLYIFGEIQYTSTAAVLAVGGYLCLLLDDSKYRRYILFFFFELLALLLRSQAMLMIQLMGGALFGVGLLVRLLWKEQRLKELCREGVTVLGILVFCLVLAWVGNHILADYDSEQWQTYTHFREIRGDMADYYGFPAYDRVAEILDRYEVSENEYIAFTRYWMLGNEIDIACLEELHQEAEADYKAGRGSLGEILKGLLTSRFQGGIMGYGKYTLMLYAFVGALILVQRKWQLLFSLATLNLSRNVILGYLLYRGRLPFRVLCGLYFVEMVFLLAWLFLLLREIGEERLLIRLGAAAVALAVTVISVDTIKGVYDGLYWTHQGRESYSQGMEDLIAYCTGDDGGYICVEMATTYYTGEALDMSWYRDRNYLSCGFWWSTSPHIAAYQQEYLEAHQGNLRLIEMGEGMDPGQSFAVELFTEDWGLELSEPEQLELGNGIILQVYDVQERLSLEDRE